MPYSNISAVMTTVEKAAINDGLDAVSANMAYAVHLTPKERMAMPGLSDAQFAFAVKCMEYAIANTSLVPAYSNLAEAVKDQNLYIELSPIKAKAAQMHELIDDTQHATGHEWYKFSLEFYRTVQRASRNNVPGSTYIYNDLKQLFNGQGNPGDRPPAA